MTSVERAAKDGYSARDGLIWKGGEVVGLPYADIAAQRYGFPYAEHLVKALEKWEEQGHDLDPA